MKQINEFDEVISGSRAFNESVDNQTILRAYEHTQEAGNERLNFDDVIWDRDIPEIAKMVKMLGLREFTISARQGNLIDVLAAFQELGVFMDGVVQVAQRWDTRQKTSAILMKTF